MRRNGTTTRIGLLLISSFAIACAHALTLPDPDLRVTFELPERDVERLARRVEAILVAHGFTKAPGMSRHTEDGYTLPASAPVDDGIIAFRVENESALRVYVLVTRCRAVVSMRPTNGTGKADGETQLHQTREALLDGLSSRTQKPWVIVDDVSIRSDPCAAVDSALR